MKIKNTAYQNIWDAAKVVLKGRFTVINAGAIMCHLMTGIPSEKCSIMQLCHFVNIIQCTYTNLRGIAYYTFKLCYIHCRIYGPFFTKTLLMWLMTVLCMLSDHLILFNTTIKHTYSYFMF